MLVADREMSIGHEPSPFGQGFDVPEACPVGLSGARGGITYTGEWLTSLPCDLNHSLL
jgi:hypothetical protein